MSEILSPDYIAAVKKPESDSELIARLMRFYSVDSLTQLILAQNRHVEKLQAQLPRLGLDREANPRIREG